MGVRGLATFYGSASRTRPCRPKSMYYNEPPKRGSLYICIRKGDRSIGAANLRKGLAPSMAGAPRAPLFCGSASRTGTAAGWRASRLRGCLRGGRTDPLFPFHLSPPAERKPKRERAEDCRHCRRFGDDSEGELECREAGGTVGEEVQFPVYSGLCFQDYVREVKI